jgi:hypothetical protein
VYQSGDVIAASGGAWKNDSASMARNRFGIP